MTAADWIQFGVLLIALITLAIQISKQRGDAKRQEERTENKLEIFFLCQDTARSEQQIIQYFKEKNPGKGFDEAEIKKSIYDMLKDGTLRYRSTNTFKARRNKAKEDDE